MPNAGTQENKVIIACSCKIIFQQIRHVLETTKERKKKERSDLLIALSRSRRLNY